MHYFVSLWNYLYYHDDKSLDEILAEIDSHGFGVELWPAISTFNPYRPEYHQSNPRRPDEAMDDLVRSAHRERLRLSLGSMRSVWHSRAFDDEPKLFGSFDAHAEEIDTAAFLSSEAIAVHYIGESLTTQGYSGGDRGLISDVLDYAEDRGVKIALETRDYDSLTAALNEFDKLTVCLDPACIRACSDHPLQDFTALARDRISMLHLYDSRSDEGHLTPGSGDIPMDDWRCMMDVLKSIDFRGAAVLEIKPPPEKKGQTPIEAAEEARNFFLRLGA
jgi:sugar phosphate isomerase/epimerase